VLETEECVISSDSLSFEEYVELRILAFILWTTNVAVAYDAIKKLFSELDLDIFDLFFQILKTHESSPSGVYEVIDSYRKATKSELWNSSEEIIEYFQNNIKYNKLLNEEAGINVIQFHHAIVMSKHMEDWTENVIQVSKNIIKENCDFDKNLEKQFQDIANYCRGLTYNILGKDRLSSNFKHIFEYDVSKWLLNNSKLSIDKFLFIKPQNIIFKISDEQYQVVQNEIDRYGESTTGLSKATKHLQFQFLLRTPVISTQT
jgi:hypothetical protein